MFGLSHARMLLLALIIGVVCGCGGSTASISGEVTYNGAPLSEGYITFQPEDGKTPPAGSPIENGHYEVDNIAPGPKVVKIEAVKKLQFPQSSGEDMPKKGAMEAADVIPANAHGNNTRITIEPGQQTHNFPLKRPGTGRGR